MKNVLTTPGVKRLVGAVALALAVLASLTVLGSDAEARPVWSEQGVLEVTGCSDPHWTQVSGPASAAIHTPLQQRTLVTMGAPGFYEFAVSCSGVVRPITHWLYSAGIDPADTAVIADIELCPECGVMFVDPREYVITDALEDRVTRVDWDQFLDLAQQFQFEVDLGTIAELGYEGMVSTAMLAFSDEAGIGGIAISLRGLDG